MEQKSSKFAYAMLTTTPNPGLEVEGVGQIELPLSHDSAPALIEVCNQAPFGKGSSTLVDKQVRDTWEVDASKAGPILQFSLIINELICSIWQD